MMEFLGKVHAFLGKLGGKRFLVAFGALLAIVLHEKLGIDEATVNTYAGVAAAYLFGQTVLDKATGGATSSESNS